MVSVGGRNIGYFSLPRWELLLKEKDKKGCLSWWCFRGQRDGQLSWCLGDISEDGVLMCKWQWGRRKGVYFCSLLLMASDRDSKMGLGFLWSLGRRLKVVGNDGVFVGFSGVGWWIGERPRGGKVISRRWERLEMGGGFVFMAARVLCMGDLERKMRENIFWLFFICFFFLVSPTLSLCEITTYL